MLLSSKNPTLLDLANMPANKDAADIINLLGQFNPILQEAPAFECNQGTKHLTTIRTGLPTPTWGKLYKGVVQSKGTRQQITDTTGFLQARSEVATLMVDVVEKAEDKASLRFEEAEGHLESMSQEMASAIFYHDTAIDPEKPMGFLQRFNNLSGAENSKQIIDAGGPVGNFNTSLWMITWDKKASHLLYPKGSQAGVKRTDNGRQRAIDPVNGGTFYVYEEEYLWNLGLTVRDWRYVARLANIDAREPSAGGTIKEDASVGIDLLRQMTHMYYRHNGRKVSFGRTSIYANTFIVKYLDFQAREKTGTALQLTKDQTGENAKEIVSFRGTPIRETDALLSTEARTIA